MTYKHKKTNNLYTRIGDVTIKPEDIPAVLYTDGIQQYVRTRDDFNKSFVRIGTPMVNKKAERKRI